MTFADYMETALFDPEDGYYTTRASLGFEGDYVTSVDLGPAFGRSLARAVADLWALVGKPSPWDLVEAGAGRGILMRDLLGALERERPDAARVANALVSGYVVLIDYGGDETELLTRQGAGTVRGFAQHRLVADPLLEPGRHDLTASVDFTAIRRAAEGAGLRFAGSATQRDMLLALGIREATARPSTPIEQLRAASRRSAIDALLDPNGLGAFKVVCFAKDAPTEGLRMFGGARAESAARYP